MEIINKGKYRDPAKIKIKCNNSQCECEFELDCLNQEDIDNYISYDTYDQQIARCPQCNNTSYVFIKCKCIEPFMRGGIQFNVGDIIETTSNRLSVKLPKGSDNSIMKIGTENANKLGRI